jgi:hypothetical protein
MDSRKGVRELVKFGKLVFSFFFLFASLFLSRLLPLCFLCVSALASVFLTVKLTCFFIIASFF